MILVRNLRLDPGEDSSVLRARAAKKLRLAADAVTSLVLVKRSLDARHKDDIHYVCSAAVTVTGDEGRVIARAKCADAAAHLLRAPGGLHVFVGVLDLYPHQLIHEVVKARAVGCVQQQPELIQMVVHVVHKLHRAAVGVFGHVRLLRITVHAVELLLYLQKALRHFAEHRLDDRGEQPLLVAEAHVDGVCARVRRRRDNAQGSVLVAVIQKLLLRACKYALGHALYLLCHRLASIYQQHCFITAL